MDGFNQFPDRPFGQAADGGKAISCRTSIFHQFPTQGNQPEGIVEGKRTGGHRCGKSADRQSGNEVRHAFLADQPVGAGHSRDQNAELDGTRPPECFGGVQRQDILAEDVTCPVEPVLAGNDPVEFMQHAGNLRSLSGKCEKNSVHDISRLAGWTDRQGSVVSIGP